MLDKGMYSHVILPEVPDGTLVKPTTAPIAQRLTLTNKQGIDIITTLAEIVVVYCALAQDCIII